MYKKFLKSKLHRVKVTETNLNYAGSITIDKELVQAAELKPFEMVQVVNVNNGERFETYVIEGERNSGYIGLNGGAAKKGTVGDELIVFSSCWVRSGRKHSARVVIIDPNNKVKDIRITKTRT